MHKLYKRIKGSPVDMSHPILITGAAGFIGFHTALKLLEKGHDVVGIDNLNDYYDVALKNARLDILRQHEGFHFEKIDIADLPALQNLWHTQGPFKKVIHLAAQAGVRYSIENPHAYVSSNLVGHLNMLEMCRNTDGFAHLVYASSSSVYGGNTELPYAVSQAVDRPVSLYAATKKSDELMSYSYAHLYGIPQTGFRFFTVYGPWGRPDMAYFLFARAISEGKTIKVFNHGDMKRDFTYIDDVVDGLIKGLNTPPTGNAPHRVLNLGNHRSEKLLDFIAVIEKELGREAQKEFLPMQAGDVKETYADISQTQDILDYAPKISIQDGLHEFVKWFKGYY
jgi:UDP-glucuronate 4-epimerase